MKNGLESKIEQLRSILLKQGYSFDDKKLSDISYWRKRNRLVIRVKKNKDFFVFKALLVCNREDIDNFFKEIFLMQFFADTKPPFDYNTLINSDEKDFWLISSYLRGDNLGNILEVNDAAIDFRLLCKKILDYLKYAISVTKGDNRNLKLKTVDESRDILKTIKLLHDAGYPNYGRALENNYTKIFDLITDESKYIFSHGDLSPINVLSSKEKNISIIDWELLGLRDIGYDAAYFAHRFVGKQNLYFDFIGELKKVLPTCCHKLIEFWLLYWQMFDVVNFDRFLTGKKFANSEQFSSVFIKNRRQFLLDNINLNLGKEEHLR